MIDKNFKAARRRFTSDFWEEYINSIDEIQANRTEIIIWSQDNDHGRYDEPWAEKLTFRYVDNDHINGTIRRVNVGIPTCYIVGIEIVNNSF